MVPWINSDHSSKKLKAPTDFRQDKKKNDGYMRSPIIAYRLQLLP